jgi:hypothetical protein
MTPLDKTLKRVLPINGVEYVITLTPKMLKITRKGRRVGVELGWEGLISGDSALAVALHASIGRFDIPAPESKRLKGDRIMKSARRARIRQLARTR